MAIDRLADGRPASIRDVEKVHRRSCRHHPTDLLGLVVLERGRVASLFERETSIRVGCQG